jgi:hypothetical protein
LTDNKLCHVVFVRDHRPSRTTLRSMHACTHVSVAGQHMDCLECLLFLRG